MSFVSTLLKWITGVLEAILGVPVLGGYIIISFYWLPLIFMLSLHIITLIFSIKEKQNKHGSVLGIITSCIVWIPIVGMVVHIITAVFLLIDAYRAQKKAG